MAAKREGPQKHSWIRDQFDSGNPPQIEAPYFDPDLGSWVLSRYVDILAAFHAASLIPGRRDLANVSLDSEERARFRMREEVRDALCPSNVRVWREELIANSESLRAHLIPSCAMAENFAPFCRMFAGIFAARKISALRMPFKLIASPRRPHLSRCSTPEDL
jgi:hypothetical protein